MHKTKGLRITLTASSAVPALWHEPAPRHFDQCVPWWVKTALLALFTVLSIFFLDQRIAVFAQGHPIPDLSRQGQQVAGGSAADRYKGGDVGRDLLFLEQWGQWACSVAVIAAVGMLDPKGRRRALAIAVACLLTFLVTHFLKDLIGRSRPFVAPASTDGSWIWGGPAKGFHGSAWASFPSAHTTGAFALAAALSWFYPRGRALFMSLAVITAAQRVLHTAHYLSDVLAGLGIGVFVARWSLQSKLAGRLIALGPKSVQRWWLGDAFEQAAK